MTIREVRQTASRTTDIYTPTYNQLETRLLVLQPIRKADTVKLYTLTDEALDLKKETSSMFV